jgi:signal-transduction protein with cAMP-binding, CBS, and nucleotidyltransferase domain
MHTIDHVLETKGHAVYWTTPETTIQDVVIEMCRVKVGALLVEDERGSPVGVISERDLMIRVLLGHRDPAKTTVGEVMTPKVVCIEANRAVHEALAVMTSAHCRHLPVVARGEVVGLVSIGDLAREVSADQEYELRMLHDYVDGKYPG